MLGDATVTRNSVDTPVEAMSRRALLTASAGLLGAAALAPGASAGGSAHHAGVAGAGPQ